MISIRRKREKLCARIQARRIAFIVAFCAPQATVKKNGKRSQYELWKSYLFEFRRENRLCSDATSLPTEVRLIDMILELQLEPTLTSSREDFLANAFHEALMYSVIPAGHGHPLSDTSSPLFRRARRCCPCLLERKILLQSWNPSHLRVNLGLRCHHLLCPVEFAWKTLP